MSSPGDAAEWTAVLKADEVGDGEIVAAQVGAVDVAVVRVGAELYCINDICTHALGYLDEGLVEGYEVECPLHGGRFDVRTGAPLCEPVEVPVATYPVKEEGGMIHVRVDDGDGS